ncbi:MAG: recombination protein RecR, partial [Oscillospiraceae bacterium]|nr:recombination protein RecR [Oscillospiraceae bacterium]
MGFFPAAFDALTEQFARLPGVGTKTAQRLAFYILSLPDEEAERFAQAIRNAKSVIRTCSVCQNLTDSDICPVCASEKRDKGLICVVSDPKDVAAIERAREYRGTYHVLYGVISPMNHIGPEDIRIKELVSRVAGGDVREVIMATNPDTEGETTALYITRLLKP